MTDYGQHVLLSTAQAAQIEEIRRRYRHDTSSHAFDTLYIWRHFVGGELYLEPELFSLRYQAKGDNTWLFPCGSREDAERLIAGHIGEPGFSLCYLRDEDKKWLEETFPSKFIITPAPGDSEYVVSRPGHLALAGKRYEKLRSKVHRAERENSIVTEMLGPDNIDDATKIIREWHGSRQAIGSLKMYGDEEDAEPLMIMEQLKISGILMRVNGEPYGVAAGFMLSDDTFDLFLAKECARDPSLGYYLRRELMRVLPDKAVWVNLEDDLDIEGLRIMKKQMIPEKMNDMWTAVLQNET